MEGYKECRYLVCILSIAHSLNIRYLTLPFSPYFHDSDSFILQLHRIIWQELHTILSKIIKKPQYANITFKNGQLAERTLDRGSKKISEQWVWMSILNFFKHYKVRTFNWKKAGNQHELYVIGQGRNLLARGYDAPHQGSLFTHPNVDHQIWKSPQIIQRLFSFPKRKPHISNCPGSRFKLTYAY